MTNKAEAILIDSREPDWVQHLTFGGVCTTVMALEIGDIHVATSDGCILMIERKTPEDFLNSLRDDRLLSQCAKLVQERIDDQVSGAMSHWPYLLISGNFSASNSGKTVIPERGETGWAFAAVQGALQTIQEMGVMIVYCTNDYDLEAAILRLAARSRENLNLLPPRPPAILGIGAAFLAGLPGIGVERSMELMRWGNNVPAHVIAALTDLEVTVPGVGLATKRKIRGMLGLRDGEQLVSPYVDEKEREIIKYVSVSE